MKVSDIMTRDVHLLSPEQTIREAAGIMADIDAGALPVGDDDRLVGMITDRDIVVRAIAQGKSLGHQGRRCHEQGNALLLRHRRHRRRGAQHGQGPGRRLPVVNHAKRLVGIVSLGDLARNDDPTTIGRTVSGFPPRAASTTRRPPTDARTSNAIAAGGDRSAVSSRGAPRFPAL